MTDHMSEGRLDRRGFLAAAAGAAATGVAAGALGPWSGKAHGKGDADTDLCVEHPSELPKLRRGAQTYTMPAAAWNTEATFLETMGLLKSLNINAWEFAGAYPVVNGINLGTNPAGWATFGSYAKPVRLPARRHARRPGADERGEPRFGDHEDERLELQPARRRLRLAERSGCGHGDHHAGDDLGVAGELRDDEHVGQGVPDRQRRGGAGRQPGVHDGAVQRQHGRGSPVRALLPALPLRAGQVDHRYGHQVRQQLHLRGGVHRARHELRVRAVGLVLADGRPVDGRRRPERRSAGPRRSEPGSGQEPPDRAGPDRALAGPHPDVPRQGPRPERSGHVGRQRRRQQRPGRGDVSVRRGAVRLRPGHDAVPADHRAAAAPGAVTSTCSSATARAARSRRTRTTRSSTCRSATCSTTSSSDRTRGPQAVRRSR